MIGRLDGTVLERDPGQGRVLLDVGGVGYEVTVSLQTLSAIPEAGERCALWIHTHVREDILALYGFERLEARAMFRALTSVPKVGPRNAVSTLGGLPLAELVATIAGGDVARLTKIPGIGKRTAEQIVLTLRDKLVDLQIALASELGESVDAVETPPPPSADDGHPLRGDASGMLVALGWKQRQVDLALDRVLEDADDAAAWSLDELVRRALATLMER